MTESNAEKSVDDLLGAFSTSEPEKENPGEVARKARTAELEGNIQELANQIVTLAKGSENEDALKGALISLRTVRSRATAAIKGVPDSALGLTSTPETADLGGDEPPATQD